MPHCLKTSINSLKLVDFQTENQHESNHYGIFST
jgi:hypothetical protein